MRTLSNAMPRYHSFPGLGGQEAGSGEGGDRDNGKRTGGNNRNEGGNRGTKEENAATERVAMVASRPFNQAVARGELTSFAEATRQDVAGSVVPATIPGLIYDTFKTPVVSTLSVLTGPVAPVTFNALNKTLPTGKDINASITKARVDAAVQAALGPDWGGSVKPTGGPNVVRDRTEDAGPQNNGPTGGTPASSGASTAGQVAATIIDQSKGVIPSTTAPKSEGLPYLAGGILALKLLL
jgi:hypothetical protein